MEKGLDDFIFAQLTVTETKRIRDIVELAFIGK